MYSKKSSLLDIVTVKIVFVYTLPIHFLRDFWWADFNFDELVFISIFLWLVLSVSCLKNICLS